MRFYDTYTNLLNKIYGQRVFVKIYWPKIGRFAKCGKGYWGKNVIFRACVF